VVRLAVVAAVLAASGLLVARCVADEWHSGTSEWELLRVDGRSIELRAFVGSSTCNRYEGVAVRETAGSVAITTTVEERRHVDCTDDLTSKEVGVTLDRPLGRRALTGCAPEDALVKGRDDRAAPCRAVPR
jgi:hypothetical protein